MIKSSYSRSFLLAIVCLILLLSITMINGNDHHQQQMEKYLFEKRLTAKNAFNDLLEHADINKENIDVFIRDLQQHQQQQAYPDRRSSFHALRGKRRAE